MDVYVRQVEIIKQINSYANNNKFKKKTLKYIYINIYIYIYIFIDLVSFNIN